MQGLSRGWWKTVLLLRGSGRGERYRLRRLPAGFPGEHFRADSQDAFNVGEKVRQRLREATGWRSAEFRREFAEPAISLRAVGSVPEVTEGVAKPDGSFGGRWRWRRR